MSTPLEISSTPPAASHFRCANGGLRGTTLGAICILVVVHVLVFALRQDDTLQLAQNNTRGDDRDATMTLRSKLSPPPATPPPTAPQPRKPKRSPHHVYTCGYENLFNGGHGADPDIHLATALFPEVNTSHLSSASIEFQPDDVLIWPCGGDCPLYPTEDMTTRFPGQIITVNGESTKEKCRIGPPSDRLHPLDFFGISSGDSEFDSRINSIASDTTKTFVPGLDVGVRPKRWRQIIYDPAQRAKHVNTGERFLIYAASNCVSYRDEAFVKLSGLGTVYYGGGCSGGSGGGGPNIQRDDEAQQGGWTTNPTHFHMYRFTLAMENDVVENYVTEKIVNAFTAGSIPIYYGPSSVWDIFNPKAFVFYDIHNPQEALDRIAHLEENQTAYHEMLHEPILANGEETIERYFSIRDEEGGGRLKWAIRDRIGFG